jgi:hypothetical protein
MNWSYAILSLRNRRRGIDRHYSLVPLVSILLAYSAYQIYPYPQKNWIAIIALLDIGTWELLWIPVILIREKAYTGKHKNY